MHCIGCGSMLWGSPALIASDLTSCQVGGMTHTPVSGLPCEDGYCLTPRADLKSTCGWRLVVVVVVVGVHAGRQPSPKEKNENKVIIVSIAMLPMARLQTRCQVALQYQVSSLTKP